MITRRTLLQTSAMAAAASGLAMPAIAQGAKIKIGYVSPRTGPLAAFAESDEYILAGINAAFSEGITIDGSSIRPIDCERCSEFAAGTAGDFDVGRV